MSRQHPHIHRRKLFRRRLKRAMQESSRRNAARIDANLVKILADPQVLAGDKLQEKGLTFFEKTKTHERLCIGRSSQKTARERSEDLRRTCLSKLMRLWYRNEVYRGYTGRSRERRPDRQGYATHAITNIRFWIYTGRMPDLYTDLTHRVMYRPKKRSRRQRQRDQARWGQMMGRVMRRSAEVPAYNDTPPYVSAAPAAVSEPVAVIIEAGNLRPLP